MCSDNLPGAVNQQERLDPYIAGFVDGEGSFSVSIQRNPSCRVGWQLLPEFHVSQNPERRLVLDLIQRRLGCGRIRENHRGTRDNSLVLVVRRRTDLVRRVIPSSKPAARQLEARGLPRLRTDRAEDGGGDPPHCCGFR